MTQRTTTTRSLVVAAVLASGIIGLPAAASPTTAATGFVASVMVAPLAESTARPTVGSPEAAAEQFVEAVMVRRAGRIEAPVATARRDGEAAASFLRRVMARGSAV